MNLELIAKELGTSVATVSRAINGRPGVSARKADEILTLIKQKKYEPSRRRRSSLADSSHSPLSGETVAVLALGQGHLQHPYPFVKMIESISSVLAARGVNLQIGMVQSSRDLSPAITEGRVKGLLLMGTGCDETVLDAVSGLPQVWLTSHSKSGGSRDEVLGGNKSAGRHAAEHMLEAGYSQLVFLNPSPGMSVIRHRQDGFVSRAAEAGVEVEVIASDTVDTAISISDTPSRLDQVLMPLVHRLEAVAAKGPIGLCLPSDMVTAAIYPRLIGRGLCLGSDVAVISIDNEQQYLMGLDPRPATVDIGVDVIGRKAVEQLLWRIENPEDDRPIQLVISPSVVLPCGS